MRNFTIIGGGFSGTSTAISLLRHARGPARISIINAEYPLARGSAYSTTKPEHILNVPVRMMSAVAEEPRHFLEWLRSRDEFCAVPEAELQEQYMQRRLFGEYLGQTLDESRRQAAPGVEFDAIDGEAVAIKTDESGPHVILSDGRRAPSDRILLALGNRPPPALPFGGPTFVHPRYIANPWHPWEDRLPAHHEPIVLIGAGLTMIDAFLTLQERDWKGPIYTVSRSALLPMSYFPPVEFPDYLPPDPTRLKLRELVILMEAHCIHARRRGIPTPVVVDKLRPYTQQIFRQFTPEEKRAFVQNHRQRWGAARHRIPAHIHERVIGAIHDGRLIVVKAAVKRMEPTESGIRVVVEDEGRVTEIAAGMVLNCTGPQESCTRDPSPLLSDLLSQGLIQADDVDLGVRASANYAVIGKDGAASKWLFAIGPMLRGSLWETVAVPEIREQASAIAQTMLGD